MKPDLTSLTPQAINRSRRSFLSWLAAVPALAAIGCSAPRSPEDEREGEQLTGGEDADAGGECSFTTPDATGPYFEAGSPVRGTRIAALTEPGVRLTVEGRLVGPDCRTPLAGYALDLWQADAEGHYYKAAETDYRLRGKVVADTLGRYRFETVLPGRYNDAAGWRPAHIHARVLTPGGNLLLTTQLYFQGDPYLGEADYCTAAHTCNSSDPARILSLADSNVSGTAGKRTRFDAYLPRS